MANENQASTQKVIDFTACETEWKITPDAHKSAYRPYTTASQKPGDAREHRAQTRLNLILFKSTEGRLNVCRTKTRNVNASGNGNIGNNEMRSGGGAIGIREPFQSLQMQRPTRSQ